MAKLFIQVCYVLEFIFNLKLCVKFALMNWCDWMTGHRHVKQTYTMRQGTEASFQCQIKYTSNLHELRKSNICVGNSK